MSESDWDEMVELNQALAQQKDELLDALTMLLSYDKLSETFDQEDIDTALDLLHRNGRMLGVVSIA